MVYMKGGIYIIQNEKLVPATYDSVFKAIFTSKDCLNYTATLLGELLNIDKNYLKNNLKILNSEIPKTNIKEKRKTTDVLLSVKGNIINIEMNRKYYEGLLERNAMYYHAIYSSITKEGMKAKEYKKVIQINMDSFNKYIKPISKFVVMEEETHELENIGYEKYHINLLKIKEKYYNKEKMSYLEKLLLLIVIEDKEELKEVAKGDNVMFEYMTKALEMNTEDALKYLVSEEFKEKDDEAVEQIIYNNYRNEGREEGLKEGIKQGIEQEKIAIVKNMLNTGLAFEEIEKYTGISKEEIENIS